MITILNGPRTVRVKLLRFPEIQEAAGAHNLRDFQRIWRDMETRFKKAPQHWEPSDYAIAARLAKKHSPAVLKQSLEWFWWYHSGDLDESERPAGARRSKVLLFAHHLPGIQMELSAASKS